MLKGSLKKILPPRFIQRMKQIVRPYMWRVGKSLISQGVSLIRRSEAELLEKPVVRRYTGDDGSVLNCCVAYNRHGGYCVPLSSRHRQAAQSILQGGVHEPETIEYIGRACRTGDIVHAGTYFGDFIPPLSKYCSDSSKVWAFEPNPENYRCAEITIAINNLENVEIKNAALGNNSGYFPLRVKNSLGWSFGGSSSVELDPDPDVKTVRTKMVKIDDVIPEDRRVSLLHLDVEGFEKQALCGGLETIKRWKPVLILEDAPSEAWMRENILTLGYKYAGEVLWNTVWKT